MFGYVKDKDASVCCGNRKISPKMTKRINRVRPSNIRDSRDEISVYFQCGYSTGKSFNFDFRGNILVLHLCFPDKTNFTFKMTYRSLRRNRKILPDLLRQFKREDFRLLNNNINGFLRTLAKYYLTRYDDQSDDVNIDVLDEQQLRYIVSKYIERCDHRDMILRIKNPKNHIWNICSESLEMILNKSVQTYIFNAVYEICDGSHSISNKRLIAIKYRLDDSLSDIWNDLSYFFMYINNHFGDIVNAYISGKFLRESKMNSIVRYLARDAGLSPQKPLNGYVYYVASKKHQH